MHCPSPRAWWVPAVLVALVIAEVGGNVAANITFNYWMRDFPYGSQTVTVNFICAFFYVLLFLPACLAAIIADVRKYGVARVGRLMKPKHLLNGLLIALADTGINIAQTYAAGRTTVLTQVFAKSTEPIVTFLLNKFLLRDRRPLTSSVAPAIAFVCIIAAVILHLYADLHKHNAHATPFFIIFYYLGVIGSSFYAIAQSRFMRCAFGEFQSERIADDSAVPQETDTSLLNAAEPLAQGHVDDDAPSVEAPQPPIPSALIRSVALTFDCCFTLLLTLLIVPFIDTIPGFGYSDSVSDVWANLRSGMHCLVECDSNFVFGLITCGAWALVYLADTFMNHFSPTLNSVVNQFTAPVGVIVLMLHSAWALGSPPSTSTSGVLREVLGALLLTIGAGVYARFELMSSKHGVAIAA